MSQVNDSPARPAPRLLIAAILGKAAWVVWLGWHGLPYTTSDGPCFKQPAYMRLFTSHFSIPSYAGNSPYAELLNSYPSTVYTYANYIVFKVFGFSQFTSIAFDLSIHFSLSVLGAWALWRLTGSQLAALVFLVGSVQWLIPFGRPEEFGVLLVLLALLMLERDRFGFLGSLLALGLAGASSPGAAVVGTTLLVAFEVLQRGVRQNWARPLAILFVPAALSLTLYAAYVYPYFWEAVEQDRHMRETDFYYRISPWELVRINTPWAIGTYPVLFAAIALALVGFLRPPHWFPRRSTAGHFVIAAGFAVAIGLSLNMVAQRPEYDYRHIIAIALASLAVAVSWLQIAPGKLRYAAWGLAALLVLFAIPAQRTIARQTLGLLTWSHDDVDFQEAKAIVAAVVPKNATVGGDGNAWALIDDGRPFLLTRTIASEHWPEYVISTTWADPPAAIQYPFAAKIVAEGYDEVFFEPRLPCDGCSLNVLGMKIPLARGRCDWYVRIWKRRAPISPAEEASVTSSAN